MERWQPIEHFPGYSVSDHGRIRSDKSGRILSVYENQSGVICVGIMRDGEQYHRSVPLLVARAFIPRGFGAFDTPINLDGDRHNNHVSNLEWRPRWFAVRYNQQFRNPYEYPILQPLMDIKSKMVSENSFECAKNYGLLEKDVVLSILNRTYVWPTYQEFQVIEE
jgi:hypothetical protein